MTKQNVVVSDTDSQILNMAISVAVSNSTIFSAAAERPPIAPGGYISISRKRLMNLKNLDIINGGERITSWVDSMKASSPTHIQSTTCLMKGQSSWMLQHPSALDMFEQIIEASQGKQIVMFLDYDGTLSPIVEDPDRAFMSDSMRNTVKKLAGCFPTAIVSGRCRDKVYKFVRLAELYYAGSHGMDIKGPAKGSKYKKGSQDQINSRSKSGEQQFCLSVHFRCVDEKKWSELALQVKSVLKEYPKLRLSQGRKVLEIRPTIKWDKGKALEFLLESLGYANCNDVFPVYIGDDRTDEDAFKVLRERGQGFGILVSKTPKETSATYSLQEPAEVMDFLQRLVEWKRQSVRGQALL
ncbi:hypothetical protein M0R45_000730 [Rubus argutus]|uniref:Trehalose 6-phosphate phosphatase n=1 Tax=Rubus argutus TaxID=59490 RepID=A0AAW1VM14_RUBAR